MFKRKKFTIVLIAAALALTGAYAIFGSKSQPSAVIKTQAAKPALTVSTTTPGASQLPINLSANGTITAWQEAVVSSESSGLRLVAVNVNVGDVVRAGQVLAKFATDTVTADVAQAQAAVAEAQANAANAQSNAERARQLGPSGVMSAQQVSQYLTTEQTANAKVGAAKAALASQQLRLKYTQVLAPDAGVISARTATVGTVANPGAELFRLIRQGRLEWRAEVTASELGQIKPGGTVVVAPASGVQVQGRVRTIAPTIDAQTRTALVYVDLPSNPQIKAGMFAKGEFELGQSSALTLPQQAVVVRDGFSYVFVLGAGQRVKQQAVQTGRRVGERLEVLSGLDANAVVVASGAGFLNDGDLVKVVN